MIIKNSTLEEMPGIFGILYRSFLKNPEKKVIQVGGNALYYKDLIQKGNRVASALFEIGIRKNDRVGILCANSVNWYIFMYAVLRLGAVFVPFDPQLGKYEIKYLFEKTGIRTVLVSPRYRNLKHPETLESLKDELLDLKNVIVDGEYKENNFFLSFEKLKKHQLIDIPEFEQNDSDSNFFICTTGSSGNPKIVDLSCAFFNFNLMNAEFYGYREGSKCFLTMPLYHAGGFSWGLSCLSNGGTIYYDEKFRPTNMLETIEAEKITKILTTPTLMKILLSHSNFSKYDTSSVDEIIFTGEVLSDSLISQISEQNDIRLVNALGMSEANVFLLWDSISGKGLPANNFGKIPGIDIKITDENGDNVPIGQKGLIHIKNSIMKGYYGQPEMTKKVISEDNWLNSGDLGLETVDGRIILLGRQKRVIKRGGNLISPEEIEQFLRTHNCVAAVVVDNEQDSLIGEKLIAYIQPVENAKLTKDELLSFCKGNISSYKIPDEFYFIKEIPKSSGKVNPTKLRKLKEENKLEFLF